MISNGDYVTVGSGSLVWQVVFVEGDLAILQSGLTGRKATYPSFHLTPFAYPLHHPATAKELSHV